jgi:VCBS repeat-containing protein
LTLNADGSFTYVPVADYTGPDSFTYKANDNTADSNVATVSITVSAVNSAPAAVNDSYSTNEDTGLTLSAPGVLGNDTDVDGDTLTAILVTGPAHGALTLNANGGFTYTPAANYNGSDSFTYKARDAALDSNVATVAITVNAVNDAPVAVNDGYTGSEDTMLTVAAPGVLGNDTDVEGSALTAILVSGPAHGTLALNANGSFSYTPAANYNGSDSFTYKANDGAADSNVATVAITVSGVNDAPVAVNDGYSTNEDATLTVAAPGVLGNDTDLDGDALTAIVVSGPTHGTLTLNANGSVSYTPAANYNGPDSFTYKANDGTVDSNVATVSITVNAVNDAPVAVNDGYSANEDTALTVPAPGVLGNDTDVESDPLTAILVSGPTHGTLTLNANGSFTYTPAANYNGPDSFTYKANDGAANSNVATVAIAVSGANDAPVAVNDSYSTNEDTTLAVAAGSGVLGNDTDVDGDALTAILVSGPSNGTLTLNASGGFSYTPAANYNGPDSFTYKANDGTVDSNVATVNITVNAVNDAPVAVNDSYSTNEDTPLTVAGPGVLGNDSDIDSGALTAIVVTGPLHGTLTLNANGSFTYTPAANYNGADSFTYKANDGSADSNVATVNITIAPVNDPPVASNDSFSTAEDTTAVVVAPGLLGNDTDVEGEPLTAILVSGPTHGTLTLNANGSLTYTPATNYNGTDSFTYKANDGTSDSNVATVTITITPVIDPPIAVNDSYSTNEDTTLTVAAPGVLANDVDVDGDTLAAIVVSSPIHGTLTLNPNGSLIYTPAANYNGPDSFTYKARDGATDSNVATVSITVVAVNDPPVATSDNYSTNEDTTLTVAAPGVLANDTDVDSGALTAIVVSGPSHGTLTLGANGSISYTPAANYNGPDSFTYKANDGLADSNIATVSITVIAVNDAPVANADSYSTNEDTPLIVAAPGLLANDTDVDSVLTASKVTNPTHGTVTVNSDGSFTYTPTATYNGPDSFTYRVSDGSLTSDATVSISVISVNDAPVANGQSQSLNEDATKAVTLTASDLDGDPLTFTIVTAPAHGTLTGTMPNLTYTPAANYNGADSFTFKVNDGSVDSNIATVSLTINPVNDAPVAQTGSFTTPANTPFTGQVIATDVDGDPLTYTITTQPTKGTVTVNPSTGVFTYTPLAGRTGPDFFRFKANDGKVNSGAARINVTIQ